MCDGAPTGSYSTGWTYDAMSRVRTMTYPDGEVVSVPYNNQGMPTSLTSSLGVSYVSSSNYTSTGQLLSMNFGSGVTTNYTYNSQNMRLTQLTTSGNLQNLAYQYDNVGNVTRITDTLRTEVSAFTYDDFNRLTNINLTGGSDPYSQGWTYDAIGNILTRTGRDSASYL